MSAWLLLLNDYMPGHRDLIRGLPYMPAAWTWALGKPSDGCGPKTGITAGQAQKRPLAQTDPKSVDSWTVTSYSVLLFSASRWKKKNIQKICYAATDNRPVQLLVEKSVWHPSLSLTLHVTSQRNPKVLRRNSHLRGHYVHDFFSHQWLLSWVQV